MCFRTTALVWERSQQTGVPLLVLLAIADMTNGQTGQCNPSVSTLATRCRLSVRQCQRVLQELVKSGELAVQTAHGRTHTSQYRVTTGEKVSSMSPFVAAEAQPAVAAESLDRGAAQVPAHPEKVPSMSPIEPENLTPVSPIPSEKGDTQVTYSSEKVPSMSSNGLIKGVTQDTFLDPAPAEKVTCRAPSGPEKVTSQAGKGDMQVTQNQVREPGTQEPGTRKKSSDSPGESLSPEQRQLRDRYVATYLELTDQSERDLTLTGKRGKTYAFATKLAKLDQPPDDHELIDYFVEVLPRFAGADLGTFLSQVHGYRTKKKLPAARSQTGKPTPFEQIHELHQLEERLYGAADREPADRRPPRLLPAPTVERNAPGVQGRAYAL